MTNDEISKRSGEVVEDIPTEGVHPSLWNFILSRAARIRDSLEHLLRGDVLVIGKDGEAIYEQKGDPRMAEEGIRWVVTTVGQYLTVDKIFTNLTDEEIRIIASEVRLNVKDKFYISWKEFGIKKSDLSPLLDMVDHFVFTNLTSSRDATLIEAFKPTVKRIETFRPEEKKKKFMGIIPFFGE